MESSLLCTDAKVFARSGTVRRERRELVPPPPSPRWRPVGMPSRVGCLKFDGVREAERRGPVRSGPIAEDEEWKEMGRWAGDKCRGEELGMVEMLECLEKEAIMGEDSGKEPTDYDRRARIFDKSSKVFLALRDEEEEEQQQHSPSA